MKKRIDKYNNWKTKKRAFKLLKYYNQYEHYRHSGSMIFENYKLTKMPEEIFYLELKNIRTLAFYNNYIDHIPKEIKYLENLQVLDLSYNKIENIPKEIKYLKNIKNIFVNGNCIQYIPKEEMKHLKHLTYFSIKENPIDHYYIKKLRTELDVEIKY